MIKLIDILREARQRGILYHFTPLSNIEIMLAQGYIRPNQEKQVSTTRDASLDIDIFIEDPTNNIARLMLDGDKISSKYKVTPFTSMAGFKGEKEEQIIVNGKPFPFLPYLKRIDLFISKPKDKNISKIIKILQKVNIPYTEYNKSPQKSISYTQDKEGDPKNINLKSLPKSYTTEELYYPNFNITNQKRIRLYAKKSNGDLIPMAFFGVIESSKYPDYYIGTIFDTDKPFYSEYYTKSQKSIEAEFKNIPMFNDIDWRKKWKYTPYKQFNERDIYNTYIFIPKSNISPEDFV
jgi:hypothetical protein